MFEHITRALVLDFSRLKEEDKSFILFTEKFGKIKVRAKGGFKTLARLSPHLDIGNLSQVKIVEKNSLTLVDALVIDSFYKAKQNIKFFKKMLQVFYVLKEILPLGLPEKDLWNFIVLSFLKEEIDLKKVFSFLGYAEEGKCFLCNKKTSFAFDLKEQNFICENCSFYFPQEGLLYIDEYES